MISTVLRFHFREIYKIQFISNKTCLFSYRSYSQEMSLRYKSTPYGKYETNYTPNNVVKKNEKKNDESVVIYTPSPLSLKRSTQFIFVKPITSSSFDGLGDKNFRSFIPTPSPARKMSEKMVRFNSVSNTTQTPLKTKKTFPEDDNWNKLFVNWGPERQKPSYVYHLPRDPDFYGFVKNEGLYYMAQFPWRLPGDDRVFNDMCPLDLSIRDENNDNHIRFLRNFSVKRMEYLVSSKKESNLEQYKLSSKNIEQLKKNYFSVKMNEIPRKKLFIKEETTGDDKSISMVVTNEEENEDNSFSNRVEMFKPLFARSRCVVFNDCYKYFLEYDEKEQNEDRFFHDFGMKLLVKGEKGRPNTWGLKLPKTSVDISWKEKKTMKNVNYVEMGKGITIKNASVYKMGNYDTSDEKKSKSSVRKNNTEPIVEGDVFSDGKDVIRLMDPNWLYNLKNISSDENSLSFTEIHKDKKGLIVRGKEENDKWIVFRWHGEKMNLLLNFTIPYVASDKIGSNDSFKLKSWYLRHRYTLNTNKLYEEICFNPNSALSRKILPLDCENVSLKSSDGLSNCYTSIRLPYAVVPGESRKEQETEENLYSFRTPVISSTTRSLKSKSFSSERAILSSRSLEETTSAKPDIDERTKDIAYGFLKTSSGDFISRDERTIYDSVERFVSTSYVHYFLIDIDNINIDGKFAKSMKMRSVLIIKTDPSTDNEPLTGEPSSLTFYSQDGTAFKQMDCTVLKEEQSTIVDMEGDDEIIFSNPSNVKQFDTSLQTDNIEAKCDVTLKLKKRIDKIVFVFDLDGDVSLTTKKKTTSKNEDDIKSKAEVITYEENNSKSLLDVFKSQVLNKMVRSTNAKMLIYDLKSISFKDHVVSNVLLSLSVKYRK